MRLCPYCGHRAYGPGGMCPHHASAAEGDDWATSNRIMCDFIHRGIVTPVAVIAPPEALDLLLEVSDASMAA